MEIKTKVINLNKLGNVQDETEFLREDKVKFVEQKIKDRVDELNEFESSKEFGKSNARECFDALRGHDTILIDGQRGSGKTTLLAKIKQNQNTSNNNDAYIFRVIDPTLINIQNNGEKTNSDILLMLLSQVYTLVIRIMQENRYEGSNVERYQTILKKIKKINNSIIQGYYADSDMDYNERLYSFNKGLTLDYHLHELFDEVCQIINKKILVFMIDDIDMELAIAFNIIDVIRRYLSSPRVIPIVAMNSSQAYSLIKKNFFEKFKQEVDKPSYAIQTDSDLEFLKSLPRAYMLKSFLPSRRVETDDMYTIYRYYNDPLKTEDIPDLRFIYTNSQKVQFDLDSKDLLTYFINVVYGTYRKYHINKKLNGSFIDYLENLSMRSFITDMRNFLEVIVVRDEKYVICKSELKDNLIKRFLDYPRPHNRIESVLVDMWGQFIENANFVNKEGYHGDIIKKTLSVDGYNAYDRYPKTYHRLWMHSYFLNNIEVNPQEKTLNNNKIIIGMSIKKNMKIMGVFEFALRSMIPMNITKRYIMRKSENGELTSSTLSSSKIMLLKAFATDKLQDLLKNLAGLERKLSGKKRYLGGINNLTLDIEKPYELILYDWVPREHTTIKKGSMSFLKSLVFFMEYSSFLNDRINDEDKTNEKAKVEKFILDYLPIGYIPHKDKMMSNKLAESMSKMSYKILSPSFEASETSFGMISIQRFSKRVVENFSYLYTGMHCDENCTKSDPCKRYDCAGLSDDEKKQTQGMKRNYFNYCFSIYISTFLNAFLVELVESLSQDIPIYKGYLSVNQNFEKSKRRDNHCSIDEVDESNLLFKNLAVVQKYFNENNDTKIRNTLYSIVIFIVRALKYYYIWSEVCKDAYNYNEIFVAKKYDEQSNKVENLDIFVSGLDCSNVTVKLANKRKELSSQSEEEIEVDKYFYDEIYPAFFKDKPCL